MSPEPIRDDLPIGDFLQGKLGPRDSERFIASYTGDAGRMQQLRAYIREREIAERFLRNDLSEDAKDAYEKICLADQELFDELRMLERLEQGLAELAASGQLSPAAPRRGWRSLLITPQYAVAASVLLAVSLISSGLLLRDNLALRAARDATSSFSSTQLIPLLRLRSTAAVTVETPDQDAWTVLLVDPGLAEHSSYRLTLRRATGDGDTILQLSELGLTYDQQLAMGMPGSTLEPGDYEIVIEGRADDDPDDSSDAPFEQVSILPLRVVEATR